VDIIKWFFFVGLGVVMGSFGVVQLLILIFYSLPTNRVLKEEGYTTDFNKMMKNDKMSILALGLITLFVSFLVYSFASSSNWAIYVWIILTVVIIGRKQLKGNDNNITDYIKSHQRFLVDINELDDEPMNRFIGILQGQNVKYKSGLGGFLLLYAGAIAFYTYRAVYSIFGSMELLSSPDAIGYIIQIDSKIIPFTIIQLIISIGVVTFGVFVLYSIIKKKKTVKAIVRNYHISLIVVSVATLIMASFIPSTLENENIYRYVIEVVITIIFAVWGIQYFNVSRRIAFAFFGQQINTLDDHYNIFEDESITSTVQSSFFGEQILTGQEVDELTEDEKEQSLRKRRRLIRHVGGLVAFFLGISFTIWYGVNHTNIGKYLNANALYQMGKYEDAIIVYGQLGEYKDSDLHVRATKYKQAVNLYNKGNLEESLDLFYTIDYFKNSEEFIGKLLYKLGKSYINSGNYEKASKYLNELEYTKQDPLVREWIDEVNIWKSEELIKERKYAEVQEILSAKLYRVTKNSALYPRIEKINEQLDNNKLIELYIDAVEDYEHGLYPSAEKKFEEITGFNEFDDYKFQSMNNILDARKYLILIKVKMLDMELRGHDIMFDHIMMTDNRLENLFEAAKSIIDFKNMNDYLDRPIFTPVRLQGKFSNEGVYFEYIKNGNYDTEVQYNIPWYDGKYFRLIENATIMQNGDDNNWVNVYRFSFDNDRILNVYSYKNGRTYKLYKNY